MVKFSLTPFGQQTKLRLYLRLKIILNIFTCSTHQGVCSCGNKYVGETMTNATTWIDKHEQAIPNGNLLNTWRR